MMDLKIAEWNGKMIVIFGQLTLLSYVRSVVIKCGKEY